MTISVIAAVTWGFLVGFVCWAACFRCAEPVTTWLLPKANPVVVGVSRLLVTVFFIISTLVSLALVPLINTVSQIKPIAWQSLYGSSFIGSLVGFFIFGIMSRLSYSSKK